MKLKSLWSVRTHALFASFVIPAMLGANLMPGRDAYGNLLRPQLPIPGVVPLLTKQVDADSDKCFLNGDGIIREVRLVGIQKKLRCTFQGTDAETNNRHDSTTGHGIACGIKHRSDLIDVVGCLNSSVPAKDRDISFGKFFCEFDEFSPLRICNLSWSKFLLKFESLGFGAFELGCHLRAIDFGSHSLRFSFNRFDLIEVKTRDKTGSTDHPRDNGDKKLEVVSARRSFEPFEHWIMAVACWIGGVGSGFFIGVAYVWRCGHRKFLANSSISKIS